MTFTAVTFAPVQSFIRSSRKLRDLYGSSLLLSHLARALYDDAFRILGDGAVVSPADVSISRGVPNTLIIRGDYPLTQARKALLATWEQVLNACRSWLERTIQVSAFSEKPQGWSGDWDAGWGANWRAAALHSWEVFQGQGVTISAAREALDRHKQQRDWQIPNWTGESSTLSSTEAVLRPSMAAVIHPWKLDTTAAQQEARSLLEQLRKPEVLGEAFAEAKEEISLVEMVKRLITYEDLLQQAFSLNRKEEAQHLLPKHFSKLSTRDNSAESILWFMADGDKISQHLKTLSKEGDEELVLREFSSSMRRWAAAMYDKVPLCMGADPNQAKATVVYAGGDDLLGALHESTPGAKDLHTGDLWHWLKEFPVLWKEAQLPEQSHLTMSMGLVWAHANVPQREALQHARDAEATAKKRGRDRFAIRLLYPSGNFLEWSCPWTWLHPILHHYRDREGRCFPAASWRHLAEDIVWLQERQAIGFVSPQAGFNQSQKAVLERNARADSTSIALWKAYFPELETLPIPDSSPVKATKDSTRFSPSLLQPEEGRPLHLWLRDLGLIMAGLETREAA